MEDQPFDPIEAEKKELDLLNNRGIDFEVGRRFTWWLSKSQTRKFTIRPLMAGCLDRLSAEYIKLDLDEDLLREDSLMEAKVLVRKHAKRCAKIIATAVLNNSPLYPILIRFLTTYFYWRVTPKMIWQLTVIILKMSDYKSFVNSIRYQRITRTTRPPMEPGLVEENPEE